LLAKFEVELDSLLDWAERSQAPTLVEIEDAVLRARREMSKAMAEELVNAQESVQPAPGPRCPTCHEEMHVKGRKHKYVESRLGPVQARRCYYHCPRCKRGFFPPR